MRWVSTGSREGRSGVRHLSSTQISGGLPSGWCTHGPFVSCSRTTHGEGGTRSVLLAAAFERSVELVLGIRLDSQRSQRVGHGCLGTTRRVPPRSKNSVATPQDVARRSRALTIATAWSAHGWACSSSAANETRSSANMCPMNCTPRQPRVGPVQRQIDGRLSGHVEGGRSTPPTSSAVRSRGRGPAVEDVLDQRRGTVHCRGQDDVEGRPLRQGRRVWIRSMETAVASAIPDTSRPRSRRCRVSGCSRGSSSGATGVKGPTHATGPRTATSSPGRRAAVWVQRCDQGRSASHDRSTAVVLSGSTGTSAMIGSVKNPTRRTTHGVRAAARKLVEGGGA